MTVRLSSPRLRVVLDDRSEPVVVQTIAPDMLRYESTAERQRPPWPIDLSRAGVRGLMFMAWAALTRTKELSCSWDDFSGTAGRPALCVEVTLPEEEAEALAAGDGDELGSGPTRPVLDTG